MNIHVLVIEDDPDLAASLIEYLELENIVCDHAANGVHGVELAAQGGYDVILLDVMLPMMDGYGVCETLRRQGVDTPILMVTARDTLDDKINGFEAGTDDYLVKPFALKELLFRVKALAKRRSSQPRKYVLADLVFETEKQEVRRSGQLIKLAPKETALLECLFKASPSVVPRTDLIRSVWGDETPESNSLKVHMHKLRQKVDKPFDLPLIRTIAGSGFALRKDDKI